VASVATMACDARDEAEIDSDDDQLEERPLRFADIMTEVPNGDIAAATELLVTERSLTSVDSLESLKNLKKLELRGNRISELSFLEMNHELCWLGLARNKLGELKYLNNLSALAVLDISDNRISRLDGLSGLQGLKALIATRNRISRLEGLSPKKNPQLETLVMSHNQLAECRLTGFSSLKKLSIGHNRLHAFPDLKNLPALAELRLNGNKIPSVTSVVSQLPKLGILDVGNNVISEFQGLEPLRGLLWLKSLTLQGNTVAEEGAEKKLEGLLASLKKLEILNNKRRTGQSQKKRHKKANQQWWNEAENEGADTQAARSEGKSQKSTTSTGKSQKVASEASKNGKKPPKQSIPAPNAAANETAAKGDESSVAVHGRTFKGKRAVFDDSDAEAATKVPGPSEKGSAPSIGRKGQIREGKVDENVYENIYAQAMVTLKKEKKKVQRDSSQKRLERRGLEPSIESTAVVEKDSKRKVKRKVRRPRPERSAPPQPEVARKPRKKTRIKV